MAAGAGLVFMLVICWVPEGGQLKEAWRIEKTVSEQHCRTMQMVFNQGGKAGAFIVRCDAKKF